MKPKRTKRKLGSGEGRSLDAGDPQTTRHPDMEQAAGYHVGSGEMATLGEVIDSSTPTRSLAELTEQQRVDLTIARLQTRSAETKIAMIGPGIIDRNRAIAEVQARSRIGKTLVEIECMSVSNQLRQAGKPE
jgi:hypothetical protein